MLKSEYDQEAIFILHKEILLHKAGKCTCNLEDQTKPKCIAGMWLDNKIPSKQIVQDYYLEKRK